MAIEIIYSHDEFKMKWLGIYLITWQDELPFVTFYIQIQCDTILFVGHYIFHIIFITFDLDIPV